MIIKADLPTIYAEMYGIAPQSKTESRVNFRIRVATELANAQQMSLANEVLNNVKMTDNPSAYISIDGGYGPAHIRQLAEIAEGNYQTLIHHDDEGGSFNRGRRK